jgi:cell division protein FtsL
MNLEGWIILGLVVALLFMAGVVAWTRYSHLATQNALLKKSSQKNLKTIKELEDALEKSKLKIERLSKEELLIDDAIKDEAILDDLLDRVEAAKDVDDFVFGSNSGKEPPGAKLAKPEEEDDKEDTG